jgi:hypothetical protein
MTEPTTWTMKVPTDVSGRMELLAVRPMLWEFLLFGTVLHAGIERTETKWRDYHLGYSMNIGPVVIKDELLATFNEKLSRSSFVVSNLSKILSQPAQEAAFGLPGLPGDANLIEHMANRLIDLYEQLLDWTDGIRSLRVPGGPAEDLREAAVAFVSQPIAECRAFVPRFIASIEEVLIRLKGGEEKPIHIAMELTFKVSDDVPKQYKALLRRALR